MASVYWSAVAARPACRLQRTYLLLASTVVQQHILYPFKEANLSVFFPLSLPPSHLQHASHRIVSSFTVKGEKRKSVSKGHIIRLQLSVFFPTFSPPVPLTAVGPTFVLVQQCMIAVAAWGAACNGFKEAKFHLFSSNDLSGAAVLLLCCILLSVIIWYIRIVQYYCRYTKIKMSHKVVPFLIPPSRSMMIDHVCAVRVQESFDR